MRLIFKLLLACVTFASGNTFAKSYTFTDLGIGAATGINNHGQIVGYTGTIDPIYNFILNPRAVKWQSGSQIFLETPNGWRSSARDINDAGDIAGLISTGTGITAIHEATIWSDLKKTKLSSLGGLVEVMALNNLGQAAGYSFHPENSTEDPIFWSTYNAPSSLGFQGFALDINNHGQIVGPFNGQPMKWQNTNAFILPLLDGMSSGYTSAINDMDQVVGGGTYANNERQALIWNNGTPTALNQLADLDSDPREINNSGQIVGVAYTNTDFSNSRAVLWDHLNPIDLNTYLDPKIVNEGWVLRDAVDINEDGWIVGVATKSNEDHAFLLTPSIPEPHEYAMLIAGLAVILFSRHHRINGVSPH